MLDDIILGDTTFDDAIAAKTITIEGNATKVTKPLSLLDAFELWFNIVTP